MPTSPIYDSTRATLGRQLPDVRPSQLDTLALVVAGIVQSVSAQLGKIARAMSLDTTQYSKEQRLRRFLDNERITQIDHYQPLLCRALSGLKGQRVQLLIDRVVLQERQNILVVSIGFRRRSIPLAWTALAHQGKSSLADQQALLEQALAILPPRVRVTVHGDSEFRACELFSWLRERECHAMLGVYGNTFVRLSPDGPRQTLQDWLPGRQSMAYLEQVYLTEEVHGPVNVIAWWVREADGSWMVRAVMTDLPATWQTYVWGSHRMWIETVFRDWQSGGFHLERCGISSRDRIARLLLALAIAYVWLVCLGRWVVKRGYRRLIDDGSARAWHFSLFQLGVGWKEHLANYLRPIPVILYLYL